LTLSLYLCPLCSSDFLLPFKGMETHAQRKRFRNHQLVRHSLALPSARSSSCLILSDIACFSSHATISLSPSFSVSSSTEVLRCRCFLFFFVLFFDLHSIVCCCSLSWM
jgi:hypothetical protein